MSRIWAITIKDLRLIARDKSGLFFLLFFPIIFAVFFGSMYGGGEGRAIPMAVLDLDECFARVPRLGPFDRVEPEVWSCRFHCPGEPRHLTQTTRHGTGCMH